MKVKFIFQKIVQYNEVEYEISDKDLELYKRLAKEYGVTLEAFLKETLPYINEVDSLMNSQEDADQYFDIINLEVKQ